MPKKPNQTTALLVQIDLTLAEQLDLIAEQKNITRSEIIRRAITEQYLE